MGKYYGMSESTKSPRDSRLSPLFGEDAEVVSRACLELVPVVFDDPELELEMIEILKRNLDQQAGFSTGDLCVALLLGEIRSAFATSVIIRCLLDEDEMLQRISIRSLQRIGGPAFDEILDLLDDPDLDGEASAMAIESLEGIALHDLPQQREYIEDRLRIDLVNRTLPIERREAAALALARLGVNEALETVGLVLEKEFPNGNVFISEAQELMTEYPAGLPTHAEDPIEQVVRWLSDEVLPGGELDHSIISQDEPDDH